MEYVTKSITIIIVGLIILYGLIKKVKVYECFIDGVKEGLKLSLRIFPYILAMIIAVSIFRESKAMDAFLTIISPATKLIGLPKEVAPLIFIKPLSGSGALGIFTDIIRKYGADTYIGRISSIIMGSTETIFYTLTIYFGSVNIKKIRHTLWAAIMADITAMIAAIFVTRLMF
jgi:spore maturation protein B